MRRSGATAQFELPTPPRHSLDEDAFWRVSPGRILPFTCKLRPPKAATERQARKWLSPKVSARRETKWRVARTRLRATSFRPSHPPGGSEAGGPQRSRAPVQLTARRPQTTVFQIEVGGSAARLRASVADFSKTVTRQFLIGARRLLVRLKDSALAVPEGLSSGQKDRHPQYKRAPDEKASEETRGRKRLACNERAARTRAAPNLKPE